MFASALVVADDHPIASVAEIPYYIRQLEQATDESKRMESDKIIHEAIVNADLSDKKTVKKLEPIIGKINAAIAAGLDRAYLEGESMWLGSAVAYFEREKNRPVIEIPESDWMPGQSTSLKGAKISTFPDKIRLLDGGSSKTVAESANIYEAVISPDGKRVAFFRTVEDTGRAEVWIVDVKTLKKKKVASMTSCATILFSLDGKTVFAQEKPKSATEESPVFRVSAGGGTAKEIGTARILETLVAKGRYQGKIIVFKATKHHLGIAQNDCPVAWDESGREIGRLKNASCR